MEQIGAARVVADREKAVSLRVRELRHDRFMALDCDSTPAAEWDATLAAANEASARWQRAYRRVELLWVLESAVFRALNAAAVAAVTK
jgi:hypothetical protein